MKESNVTLVALAAFPAVLEAHFALFPAQYRTWAPTSWVGIPSEPLTAIEQLCHIRDIEVDGYHRRFERTLAEVNPTLESIDTEFLVQQRRYATSDPVQVLANFHDARSHTLALLAKLSPAQFQRPAVFEGYGQVTLSGLVHYLCSHDQQHLAGLQWLLGKIETHAMASC